MGNAVGAVSRHPTAVLHCTVACGVADIQPSDGLCPKSCFDWQQYRDLGTILPNTCSMDAITATQLGTTATASMEYSNFISGN